MKNDVLKQIPRNEMKLIKNEMRPTIQNFMPFENPNGAFGGGGESSFETSKRTFF